MSSGGEQGGRSHRKWRPIAGAVATAAIAGVLGIAATGVVPADRPFGEGSSGAAARGRSFEHGHRGGHGHGAASGHHSHTVTLTAGGSAANGPAHTGGPSRGPGGGSGGSAAGASGANPQAAFSAPGLPAAPGTTPTEVPRTGVRYSPTPLATEGSTPCPPDKGAVECELISAPLVDPELEGTGHLGGLTPQELRSAYKLPEHGGAGTTIAVVDGPADPNAEADLNVYRREYGLPECTEANHCFKQMNEFGEVKKPTERGQAWDEEISLDLDMVSAACQECHITLVEATEEGPSALLAAEEEAVRLNPTAITNSWNIGFERNNPANGTICEEKACVTLEEEEADDHVFNHPGLPIFFAAGDYGYAVRYPANSQYVIAVGGTTLKHESGNSRGWNEEPWYNPNVDPDLKGRGGGSGCSLAEPKPKWQPDKACTKRLVSDVAANANWEKSPDSLYDSYVSGGWVNTAGTSAASPLVAGIWALSQSYSKNIDALGAQAFYKDPSALFDITSGINGQCTPPSEDEYWCTAEPGFDGPTGNGTPDGTLNLNTAATTKAATGVAAAGATLNGSVTPAGIETTYQFQYGTTTSYGSVTPVTSAGSGITAQEVSNVISGLKPETTYHYRVVATNSVGTTDGADETFKTLSLPIVTNVQSDIGPINGGTSVSISGTGLAGATKVQFGSSNASSFTVDSSTLITAVAPASASGTIDVTVTTPSGTSATGSGDHYTYRSGAVASSWGLNKDGELGNGTNENSPLPTAVTGGATELSLIAAGGFHNMAVKSGGVLAVGDDEQGQLGNAKNENKSTAVQVCAVGEEVACLLHLSEITAIAGGKLHSLALKGNAVLAWGFNGCGQLGNGTTANSNVPLKVTTLVSETAAIAAGSCFSMARQSRGIVEAWGEDKSGQLGNDRTENSNVPVPVCAVAESPCKAANDLNEVIAIAAGGSHSLALLKNGTVDAWGEGKYGELGNGKSENSSVPVKVSNLSEVTAIAAGELTSYALLSNGTVMAWGNDEAGELGNGKSENSSVPVKVGGLSEVTAIAAGANHGLALTRNGTVEAWGDNESGQLGDNSTSGPESCTIHLPETKTVPCDTSPAAVMNVGGASAIAAGQEDSIVLANSTAPSISRLEPAEGLETGGTSVVITGTKLAGVTAVKFGTTPAKSFDVLSPTTMAAVAPEGDGAVPVTLTGPGGTSTPGPASLYSYLVSGLLQGLSFSTPLVEDKEPTLTLPNTGHGISIGPMTVVGSIGEAAKVQVESKPADEEIELGEFTPTGLGIVANVEAFTAKGGHVLGPIPVTCTAPGTVTMAEMPIAATGEGTKHYSTSFNAECIIFPGGYNKAGTAKVTLTSTGPESVSPGEKVTMSEVAFTLTLPVAWNQWLYVLGAREARGSATSKASIGIVR